MSISPQLVSSFTTPRFEASRVCFDLDRCCGPRGWGSATLVQPADVVCGAAAAVVVAAGVGFSDFEAPPPQPPAASALRTASRAMRHGMAGEDTGGPD